MTDEPANKEQVTTKTDLTQDVLAETLAILKDLPMIEPNDKLRLAKLHQLLTGDRVTSHTT